MKGRRLIIGGAVTVLFGFGLLSYRALRGDPEMKLEGLGPGQLFQELQGRGSVVHRRAAAAKLAKNKDGTPWCIIVLLEGRALEDAKNPTPPQNVLSLAPFKRAIIASLLESIPTDAEDSLLWAVTSQLSDEQVGRYSYSEKGDALGITTRMLDAHTEPICVLAREALKRTLKTDHGFDEAAWRLEIISRIKKDCR